MMAPNEFRRCGLHRLSEQELDNLNTWLATYTARVSTAAKSPEKSPQLVDLSTLEGAIIVAEDGQFLGKITANEFDTKSIINSFGKYASEFSSTSIFNEFGTYGGEFSSQSPFNKFTSTPPKIYKGNKLIAYLTVNNLKKPQVNPQALVGWLKSQ